MSNQLGIEPANRSDVRAIASGASSVGSLERHQVRHLDAGKADAGKRVWAHSSSLSTVYRALKTLVMILFGVVTLGIAPLWFFVHRFKKRDAESLDPSAEEGVAGLAVKASVADLVARRHADEMRYFLQVVSPKKLKTPAVELPKDNDLPDAGAANPFAEFVKPRMGSFVKDQLQDWKGKEFSLENEGLVRLTGYELSASTQGVIGLPNECHIELECPNFPPSLDASSFRADLVRGAVQIGERSRLKHSGGDLEPLLSQLSAQFSSILPQEYQDKSLSGPILDYFMQIAHQGNLGLTQSSLFRLLGLMLLPKMKKDEEEVEGATLVYHVHRAVEPHSFLIEFRRQATGPLGYMLMARDGSALAASQIETDLSGSFEEEVWLRVELPAIEGGKLSGTPTVSLKSASLSWKLDESGDRINREGMSD